MANFKQEEGMLDFSQYLNMDQISSVTGAQAQNGKTIVSPQFTAPGPEAAFIQPQHMSQQFQGPSHNYDLFRQHSSLPPGAMQSAMQRPRQMMQSMSAMSSSSLYDISEAENNFGNMELDLNDFLAGNSSLEGYVDPNTIGSDVGDVSPVVAPVQRLYPGMHQQQAAKAQQEQQRRLQEQQKTQAQAQRQQQQPSQQPGHQKRASQGRNKHSDPVVEERITQILKQMRASTQGSQRHTSAAPQSSSSHAAKIRKEEEDMDDDERLLASEEGKKLSSKERRQLRNKVSARAFRSRRKEYISQLEGEINAKNSENDDLRYDNDMLRTENSQLTDLARMLLGHPAFNTVLEDLSSRGAQMPFLNTQAVQQPQQSQQHRASVAMSQASTQGSNTQSASSGMDFANTPINGWNGGVDAAEFNFNPTVFAVTELPEHPAIDPEVLAGKSTESIIPALPALSPLPSFDEKETAPVLEHAPVFIPAKNDFPTINQPENNHDDLYAERTPVTVSPSAEPEYQIFGSVPFEKATACLVLIDVEDAKKSEAAVNEHFASLFSRLDDLSNRISMVTGDL